MALNNVQVSGDLTQRVILQHPDLVPPQIVAGPVVVHLSDTSVSISWMTNEAATSRVDYGIGGLTSTINDSSLGTSHAVTLLNLATSSTYQFRVGSVDGSGNGPTFSSVGTFSTQAPPGDITPPVITAGPTVTSVDQTTAIIEWTTDEPATTDLAYVLTNALGTSIPGAVDKFTQTHSIRLTGLAAQTTYFVQIHSADPDNNATSSSVFSFTTLAVPDTTPPVITAGPTVQSKTDTKITVIWTTDEPATSGVSFNDGTHFDVISDSTLTQDHQITLSGLTAATTYSITVSSKDAAGNGPTLSSAISATTDPTPDTTPPVISNVTVSAITQTSAIISWTTDELSSSSVKYGATSGSPDNARADISAVVQHQVTIDGLSAGTKYYFTVSSVDAAGNVATSTESSFTTTSAHVNEPPTAPGPLTAPAITNAHSFQLSWGASTDDVAVAGYDVLRNGNVVASAVPPTVTSYSEGDLAEGSYQYQVRAFDGEGLTALSAVATVVVDRTAPQISASDVTVEATGPQTNVTYSVSAADNVDAHVNTICAPASGTSFGVGPTTVSCSATDTAGNQASKSFTIIVKDTTPPSLNVPAKLTKEATSKDGAVATFTASAVDLVDGSVTPTCSPLSGSAFKLGTTTVTCTAVDAAGNKGTATFDVLVQDTTPPVVTVPATMPVEATGPTGATATFTSSALDIVSGVVTPTCAPASGSTFPLGSTSVKCTATDLAVNSAWKSFAILVRDTTPPTVKVPADMTLEATSASGAMGIYTTTAVDLVTQNIAPLCKPASGSTFGFESTTVNCTATDGAGNVGRASFKITVHDTTPPAIASVTPSQQSLWPPDHRMVPMSVAVSASDLVDAHPVCQVVTIGSNEAVNGLGDGDTAPDWIVGPGLTFQLRAERAGKGPGRIYTITVECSDWSHNRSTKSTTVSVPKSQK